MEESTKSNTVKPLTNTEKCQVSSTCKIHCNVSKFYHCNVPPYASFFKIKFWSVKHENLSKTAEKSHTACSATILTACTALYWVLQWNIYQPNCYYPAIRQNSWNIWFIVFQLMDLRFWEISIDIVLYFYVQYNLLPIGLSLYYTLSKHVSLNRPNGLFKNEYFM